MVDAAVTLGANRTSAHEELLNVVQFEFKIRDLAQTETQTTTCNLSTLLLAHRIFCITTIHC